jgi:hypothetical protein
MRGRRTQPSDRAAKSATATQFATWCAEDQLTYTPLIIAHNEGKWGQKLTLPWTVPRPGSRLCASAAAGVISLRLTSFRTDTIRGEFDQLAKRVTAETGQSACSGGACLRQAIWSWCCLALRIPQIQHTCRYAVHRWSDSSAMRQSPIRTTSTALTAMDSSAVRHPIRDRAGRVLVCPFAADQLVST